MTTFKCPTCGGAFFSTRNPTAPKDEQQRFCKGACLGFKKGYTGCTFEWTGTDDAKYGLYSSAD